MNKNIKTALIIGGLVIFVLFIFPLIFGLISGGHGGGWGMMGPGMMNGFSWWWFMPIFPILFFGLIIWAVVAMIRGVSQPGSSDSSKAESALEVLKKRYARGEIDKEEYEEKKKDLA